MTDYEIMAFFKDVKDENGENIFRESGDMWTYHTPKGDITIPCSYYRDIRIGPINERIEIRAADHGTKLKLWMNAHHPSPWKSYYNLDIEFLETPFPQNELDVTHEKFFVIDQWIYLSKSLVASDLDSIVKTILSLGYGRYKDVTGKASAHYVLTPNDKKGNNIPIVYNQVHRNQIDIYLERLREKYQQSLIEKNATKANDLKIEIDKIEQIIKDGEEDSKKKLTSTPISSLSESKRRIRITESDLCQMIKESVTRILAESEKKYANEIQIGKWDCVVGGGYYEIEGKGSCFGVRMYVDTTSSEKIPPTYCLFQKTDSRKYFYATIVPAPEKGPRETKFSIMPVSKVPKEIVQDFYHPHLSD